MNLTKVSTINFEKKNCEPVECPNCKQNSWRVSQIQQKVTAIEHIHVTCVFCDLTYCPNIETVNQSNQ